MQGRDIGKHEKDITGSLKFRLRNVRFRLFGIGLVFLATSLWFPRLVAMVAPSPEPVVKSQSPRNLASANRLGGGLPEGAIARIRTVTSPPWWFPFRDLLPGITIHLPTQPRV